MIMEESGKALTKKIPVFVLALILLAMSALLSTKAVLGTSPIVSIPYVLSTHFGATIGLMIFLFNMMFAVLSIVLLRSRYKKEYLLAVPACVVFSFSCTFFEWLFSFDEPDSYLLQWMLVIISTVLLASGISLMLSADVTMLPADYFVDHLSEVTGFNYGYLKVALDITFVAGASLLSFLFFGRIIGIREGTLFLAATAGLLVKAIRKGLDASGFTDWVSK